MLLKRTAGWNITCSATGFDGRGRCNQDRVCILLASPPPRRELKHKQTEAPVAVWLMRGAHQPAPQRRPSPKLHTALLCCHSGAQRKATLPSASHQLIYKNYGCSYRRVCSGLLVLGAALLCLSWMKPGGQGENWPTSLVIPGQGSSQTGLAWFPQPAIWKNTVWFWLQWNPRIIVHKE